MFSRTSLECLDFSTTTLLSLTAVCILRTLEWLLRATNHNKRLLGFDQCDTLSDRQRGVETYRFSHSLEKEQRWSQSPDLLIQPSTISRLAAGRLLRSTHGFMLNTSLTPRPSRCLFRSWLSLSLVQVMWMPSCPLVPALLSLAAEWDAVFWSWIS